MSYLELFKTEVDIDEFNDAYGLSQTHKESMLGTTNEKAKKDVNFVNYPGFHKRELTELPGQLEAPQLLHRVTKAQQFNVCNIVRELKCFSAQNILYY